MFFHSCLHSKQVYTSPLAQVHKSSLKKGVRRVKLGVSFSDASSWKHWKAPGSKGHTPGQLCGCKELHAQSSLPWCWTALLPGTAQNFAQLLRANCAHEARCLKNTQAPASRAEDWYQGELRGSTGIPEKLGPKGLCLGGSEKVWVGEGRSGEKSMLRE